MTPAITVDTVTDKDTPTKDQIGNLPKLIIIIMLTHHIPLDIVQREATELHRQFNDIGMQTFMIVKSTNIEEFKYKLSFALPPQDKKRHQEFLDQNCSLIYDAARIEEIWTQLSKYWNYLNFSLLEDVVTMFCGEALIAKMEEYKKKLEYFRFKTRLCVFAKTKHKCLLMGENLKEFVVKYNKNWTECTLQDLENWKESLTQELLLPPFALDSTEITLGSVSITWAIPAMFTPSLVEKLKTLDKNFCEKHQIISLNFDGVEYLGAPVMKDVRKDTGQFYAVHTVMD